MCLTDVCGCVCAALTRLVSMFTSKTQDRSVIGYSQLAGPSHKSLVGDLLANLCCNQLHHGSHGGTCMQAYKPRNARRPTGTIFDGALMLICSKPTVGGRQLQVGNQKTKIM